MSRKRVLWALILLIAAVALNLILTRWGSDLPGTRLLTMVSDPVFARTAGEPVIRGCFTAPFLAPWPWIALVGGVLSPLGLAGIATYLLVRT